MLLNVYIMVAHAASKQRWSPHVLQCSNITSNTLWVILRLRAISSSPQRFRAPAFVHLSQTHLVLHDLPSLATNTQIQHLISQRQHMMHHIGCSGMCGAKEGCKAQVSTPGFWISFTFSHLSPKHKILMRQNHHLLQEP